jgi:ribosome recycling factor
MERVRVTSYKDIEVAIDEYGIFHALDEDGVEIGGGRRRVETLEAIKVAIDAHHAAVRRAATVTYDEPVLLVMARNDKATVKADRFVGYNRSTGKPRYRGTKDEPRAVFPPSAEQSARDYADAKNQIAVLLAVVTRLSKVSIRVPRTAFGSRRMSVEEANKQAEEVVQALQALTGAKKE